MPSQLKLMQSYDSQQPPCYVGKSIASEYIPCTPGQIGPFNLPCLEACDNRMEDRHGKRLKREYWANQKKQRSQAAWTEQLEDE
ncbi:uncharacterized protein L969DRAFT_49479 [Mixia osmundae IAM 14324]|uniref:Uncharacterized protein n=1 Tax=Mixia osmundae (strain CBS 9802 / IAM 14324 / JCM 22182 / KY 12970) TaxID=764103 RepID=G7DVM3_MIXOS|nr:uncharacterized protein L969DRAFT_49479 [Mixia osmundae IAM 14324]KEI39523.1 hypothetical protein L969DRAFT_49479 [Mixia osmundae IAM 14324]GAA94633.1 hypothetical protein E5Q_01285 [Mixia osmundae IAM 14324]